MQGVRNVCAILLVAVAAVGCSQPMRGTAYDVDGHAALGYEVPPVDTQDKGLRPVQPSGGAVLATVQPETAVQVICQAMSKQEWAQLLGSEVGRQVEPDGDPFCRI